MLDQGRHIIRVLLGVWVVNIIVLTITLVMGVIGLIWFIHWVDTIDYTTPEAHDYGFDMRNTTFPEHYVYQVIAYARDSFSGAQYPAIQATLDAPAVAPWTSSDDFGYIWTGVTLNNGYFLQIGLATSETVDPTGHMQWDVFWQVWSGNEFLYSYQHELTAHTDTPLANRFQIVCVDPELGEWEFRVNDTTIGRAQTANCAMNIANSSLTFEVVSDDDRASATQPKFGPFTLGDLQYWDDYNWQTVPAGVVSYGYGTTEAATELNQPAVCPPYGVATKSATSFQAGTGLDCLPINALVWSNATE